MKKCSKCSKNKPLEEFSRDVWSADKRRPECKRCNKRLYQKYTEEKKERQKLYREANKDKIAAWRETYKHKLALKLGTPQYRYKALKRNAAMRKIKVDISLKEYTEVLTNNNSCHYCQGELPKTGYALDRKNSGLGYSIDNVVTCCAKCNLAKSSFLSYEEMIIIREYRQKRSIEK